MLFLFINIILPDALISQGDKNHYESKYFLLLIITVIFQGTVTAQADASCKATKEIVYQSSKAGEVYLVWGTNYWHTPANELLPKNSFFKNKYAYSRLGRSGNRFSISITVPCDTRLDYYFWVPRDNKGKEVDGWDTNNDNNFNTATGSNEIMEVHDDNLRFFEKPFSIIQKGKLFLFISLIVIVFAIALFKKTRSFKLFNFLPGFLIAALIFIVLSRFEIAGVWHQPIAIAGGVLFPDLLWVGGIFFCTVLLIYIVRSKQAVTKSLVTGYTAILFITLIISILKYRSCKTTRYTF